jgi:HK97 family phage portal protein
MKPGQVQSWPRVYGEFSKEGYQKNVVVFRCISMIAHAVGSIEWVLYQRVSRKKREEIEDHPLLELLARPNPLLAKASFFENITAYRLISGNAYVSKVSSNPNKPPTELWPLRPDLMKIAAGSNGMPQGYLYGMDPNITKYPVEQVTGQCDLMHMKFFHPTDPWYGMSPIEASALQIDLHNESSLWNVSLLKNDARPSGALVMSSSTSNPGGVLGDEQFRRIKEELDHKYSGSKNAGKMALLEGGLDWKQMSLTPRDMDWVNSKSTSARDIALAFGVPPMLLGIPGDNTFSNYKEARQAFYEDTVIPLTKNTADYLNQWLTPLYGNGLELAPDKDEIDALAPKREAIWDRIEKSTILTTNEKREALGYEHVEDGDDILVPSSMTTLDALIDLSEQDDTDEGNEGEDEDAPIDDIQEEDDQEEQEDPENEGKSWTQKIFNLTSRRAKAREWKRQERLRLKFEAKMRKQVKAQFQIEGAHVADAIKGVTSLDHAIQVISREVDKHQKTWEILLKNNSTAVGKAFGKRVIESLKSGSIPIQKKDSQTDFDQFLVEWVRKNTGEKITDLTDTTKERVIKKVRQAYEEALQAGEGALPLAERINEIDLSGAVEDTYSGFSKSRSITIARTEMAAASQAASLGAAKSLDVPGIKKEWVATKDDRTREDHADADGQTVRIDEKFDVGGADLDHPGDPEGPPEEVIQCRCAMIFHRDENDLE